MSLILPSIERATILVAVTVFFLVGCNGETPSSAIPDPLTPNAPSSSVAASMVARVPFKASPFDVLVDDFDGNGLLDLALTTHNESYTQIFLQQMPRQFAPPGPRIDAVGYHPGDLVSLPVEKRRLYLMNAEGANGLRVFELAPDGGLTLVSELRIPKPRVAAVFDWPEWGLGLAVGPFGMGKIILLKNYDPVAGSHGGGADLPINPLIAYAHRITAADLDGDGSDELLFANNVANEVSVIRAPKDGGIPVIESLWRFDLGGRAEYVMSADIDRDGDVDLLVPDATVKARLDRTSINVLVNMGQGKFELTEIPFMEHVESKSGMSGIQELDFGLDQDDYGDLLVAGYESLVLMRVPRGWTGEALESRVLPFQKSIGISDVLLRDLDNDGWLDAVIADGNESGAGLIIYGPLWENFGRLAVEKSVFE